MYLKTGLGTIGKPEALAKIHVGLWQLCLQDHIFTSTATVLVSLEQDYCSQDFIYVSLINVFTASNERKKNTFAYQIFWHLNHYFGMTGFLLSVLWWNNWIIIQKIRIRIFILVSAQTIHKSELCHNFILISETNILPCKCQKIFMAKLSGAPTSYSYNSCVHASR